VSVVGWARIAAGSAMVAFGAAFGLQIDGHLGFRSDSGGPSWFVFQPDGFIEAVGSWSVVSLLVPARLVVSLSLVLTGYRLLRYAEGCQCRRT